MKPKFLYAGTEIFESGLGLDISEFSIRLISEDPYRKTFLSRGVLILNHCLKKRACYNQIKGCTLMAEYEFRHIMTTLANYIKSLNMYNAIFCDSGKYVLYAEPS